MVLTLIFGMLLGAGGLFAYQEYLSAPPVTSFDECIKAKGSITQESYPATCITRDGKRFIQPVNPSEEINPIYFDPFSCNTDSDCAIGIQPDECCACPAAINKSQIAKDGWKSYESGYTSPDTASSCQTFAACAPCEPVSVPTCQDNMCTFTTTSSPTGKPAKNYKCPKTAWVDCMPGPNEGIKQECTSEFLTWAKANCSGFEGAAL